MTPPWERFQENCYLSDITFPRGAQEGLIGPGILVPSRNAAPVRWCLEHGVRIVQQSMLMTIGHYSEPAGACLASILSEPSEVDAPLGLAHAGRRENRTPAATIDAMRMPTHQASATHALEPDVCAEQQRALSPSPRDGVLHRGSALKLLRRRASHRGARI
jgi:hypothetical protein